MADGSHGHDGGVPATISAIETPQTAVSTGPMTNDHGPPKLAARPRRTDVRPAV
jgi:hypothetical protein